MNIGEVSTSNSEILCTIMAINEDTCLHGGSMCRHYVRIVVTGHYVDGFCCHICLYSGHWPLRGWVLLVPVCLHLDYVAGTRGNLNPCSLSGIGSLSPRQLDM